MGQVFGWGPAALWAAVLFLLSESSGLGGFLPPSTDKLVHAGLFMILGLFLAWGRRRTGSSVSGLLFLLMGVGYGALDEWHQSFVPGRDASVADWVADSVGVMLGLVLSLSFSSRSRKGRRSRSKGITTTDSAQS
jgi:VanZ family protein